MTVEARTQKPQADQELFELPISERFSAWTTRLNGLERARMDLFKEGEHALSDGLQKLGIDVRRVGTKVKKDDQLETEMVRQPITLPDWHNSYSLDQRVPGQFSQFIQSVHLLEYRLKTPSSAWMEISELHFDEIALGVNNGDQKVEILMKYHRQDPYYLARHRADEEIVEFRGNSTGYFERVVDYFKDLNRADVNTKLGAALAFIKVASDLKQG